MRTILCALLSCALATAYVVESPVRLEKIAGRFSATFGKWQKTWLEERQLRVQGNSLLSESAIQNLLPYEKNNLWWKRHLPELKSSLLKSPLIESVELVSCSYLSINCYQIIVKERTPALIALVRDESKAWVVGEDGGFIAPLTNEQFRRGALDSFGPAGKKLLIVRGLWGPKSSSDEVHARVKRLLVASEALDIGAELPIELLTLKDNLELETQYATLPFPVTYDLASDTAEELREKAKRLRIILSEFEGRYQEVKKIDLAYNRLGIAEMVEHTPKSKARKKS